MAGLFTLNSATLGLLNTNVLGGLGTGFVVGESTSTGQVSGSKGATGSASGSSNSTGSALGLVAFVGSVAGSSISSGSVVGVEGDSGIVTGVTTSTGTANGTPALTGSTGGSSVSTGSASGSPDVPPTPPPDAEIVTGHRTFFQPQPPRRPKSQQLQPTRVTGGAQGRTRSRSTVVGTCGYTGNVNGSQATTGRCMGVRYPSDELVARWVRQAIEQELLTLELL